MFMARMSYIAEQQNIAQKQAAFDEDEYLRQQKNIREMLPTGYDKVSSYVKEYIKTPRHKCFMTDVLSPMWLEADFIGRLVDEINR